MPKLLAPAKLNLTLEVLARRPDGYHGLRSLMVPVARFDRLTVEPADGFTFTCDPPNLGEENIVVRAWSLAGLAPARVRLEKHVPVGAGLGGGSSDAAAVLRAAMEGALPRKEVECDWLAIARTLGSDVPFFLTGSAALVEGTGERVTAAGALPPWWAVVVEPTVGVSTADAYRMLDDRRKASPAPSRARSESVSLRALEALQRSDFSAVVASLSNDFEEVVYRTFPRVADARDALAAAGAEHVHLCGSGGCSFALFASENDANAVYARLGTEALASAFAARLYADERWRDAAGPA